MSYCRMCGATINKGETACSYCGTPVPTEPIVKTEKPAPAPRRPQTPPRAKDSTTPVVKTPPTVNPGIANLLNRLSKRNGDEHLFDKADWATAWGTKRRYHAELGIILTNTQGVPDLAAFEASLNQYVSAKASVGIHYFMLDLNTQSVAPINPHACEDIVTLLQSIYRVAVPDYLMIIGDSSVIPSIEWDNECGDDDATVPSDLPYVTLDTDSPWEGSEYNFEGVTQVGRIPASAEHNFSEACAYFAHTANFREADSVSSWAYSAYVWERTSQVEFAALQPKLITSPLYTCDRGTAGAYGLTMINRVDSRYNLLCFNLHGSDTSHTWYGQIERFYPEAFDQTFLPDESSQGYVICTEACYGARPAVCQGGEQSIVVHALSNRCLAFVGSTRIAYGCSDGSMACADIIARSFTESIAQGMTFGKAFLTALTNISAGVMDEEEIKTLAEFALYGDPSGVLVSGTARKATTSAESLTLAKTKKDRSRAITLVPCNDLARNDRGSKTRPEAVSMMNREQATLQMEAVTVCKAGKDFITTKFESFADVEPKVYKVMGQNGYRAVYSRNENGLKTVVKLHMDQNGRVEKTYLSK